MRFPSAPSVPARSAGTLVVTSISMLIASATIPSQPRTASPGPTSLREAIPAESSPAPGSSLSTSPSSSLPSAGDPTGYSNSGDGAAVADGEASDLPQINGMVYVPPGYFLMGSTEKDLKNKAEIDEYPQRRVWVDGFYIDIFEVTNLQYKAFVDSMHVRPPSHWVNGVYPKGADNYPVVGVSWYEAAAYARFVGKRLPTEEEWEKAARGTDGRRFPWGNKFDKTKCNNGAMLMPVNALPEGRSPYGIFNMAGNAAEWVDAWYAPYPRGEEDKLDPDFAEYKPRYGDRKYRVYRGGSWNNYGRFLRCANREKAKPGERWMYIGFRCAMDPPGKKEAPRGVEGGR